MHRPTLAVCPRPELTGGSHELEDSHIAVARIFFDGCASFGDRAFDVVKRLHGFSLADRFTHSENACDWLTPRSVHHAEKRAAMAGRTRTVTATAR